MNILEKEFAKSEKILIKSARICPKCGSRDVTDRGAISRDAYSRNNLCQTCGFQGPVFPEIPLKEALKKPRKQKNFNPTSMPIFAETSINWQKWVSRILLFLIGLRILLVILNN